MSRKIIIIGAGISGLTQAWYLKTKYGSAIDITILEKANRAGGCIRTIHSNGFLFEQGPRSCRSKGSGLYTLQLIEELGLQNQVIAANKNAQIRYLYINKQLQKIPTNFFAFLTSSLTRKTILPLLKEYFIPKGLPDPDESIYDFFTRRFNSEIAETFIDPVVLGIYAGDIRKLSLKACFPFLYEYEQQYGSIVKGLIKSKMNKTQAPLTITPFMEAMLKTPLFSFKHGMETLTREIVYRLDANIRYNVDIEKLVLSTSGAVLTLANQEVIEADRVISTIPAPELGKLLQLQLNNPKLCKQLIDFPYGSVVVVNLGFKRKVLNKNGFGYLVPTREKSGILGCVWDSCIFPQQNHISDETRLTVMLKPLDDNINENKNEYVDVALKALEEHLGVDLEPDQAEIYFARNAIPQYEKGYSVLLDSLQHALEGYHIDIKGNSFTGISLNDCIKGNRIIII